jgi:hypothetical protein
MVKATNLVLILKFVGKAHVAALAMEKLVSPTNSTDAAAITVILVLVLVVKQFALQTGILKVGLMLKMEHRLLIIVIDICTSPRLFNGLR